MLSTMHAEIRKLLDQALQYAYAGERGRAVAAARAARDEAEALVAPALAAEADLQLAQLCAHDALDEAFEHARRAVEAALLLADAGLQARAEAARAAVLRQAAQWEPARRSIGEAIALAERSGDPSAHARVLLEGACIDLAMENGASVVARQAELEAAIQAAGEPALLAEWRGLLAHVHAHLARSARASAVRAAHLQAASEAVRLALGTPGSEHDLALRLRWLSLHGEVLAALGDHAGAEGAARERLSLAQHRPGGEEEALALAALGEIQHQQGQLQAGRSALERAVALAEQSGGGEALARCLHALAGACEALDEPAAALAALRRYTAVTAAIHAAREEGRARFAARYVAAERAAAQTEVERLRAQTAQRHSAALKLEAERVAQTSMEDPLTGVFTHDRLHDVLSGIAHERRARSLFCVALIDADGFKQLSDAYSPQVADAVLRRLGRIVREGCRHVDLPARLGTQRFALVLSGIDGAQAQRVCERMRAAIEGDRWHEVQPGLRVTVSIGVAEHTEAPATDALLALAAQRLDAAQAAGGNRLVGR